MAPVLHCLDDPESRVRYYACESLYNIAKVRLETKILLVAYDSGLACIDRSSIDYSSKLLVFVFLYFQRVYR